MLGFSTPNNPKVSRKEIVDLQLDVCSLLNQVNMLQERTNILEKEHKQLRCDHSYNEFGYKVWGFVANVWYFKKCSECGHKKTVSKEEYRKFMETLNEDN